MTVKGISSTVSTVSIPAISINNLKSLTSVCSNIKVLIGATPVSKAFSVKFLPGIGAV